MTPIAPRLRALALLPCLAAGAAQAGVTGVCEYEGARHAFVDGAAWDVAPDEDEAAWRDEATDPPPKRRMLAFTTFALDPGALARAGDREDGLREQAWAQDGDAARLEVTFEGDEVVGQYAWISPGTNLNRWGGDIGTLALGTDAARLAGTYRVRAEDADGLACDLRFDVPHLGDPADAPPPPPPPGVALPADGGEPGRAYLALNRAMNAGDVDAMARLMAPENAAQMLAARGEPGFAQQLALVQALSPDDVRVVGGRQDGDRAWVEFTATEGGQPRAGTAEMKRVDGRWTLVEEATRDPD